MSCYFVARIAINDEAEYAKYLEKTDEVFAKFSGRYLAVDASPVTLEGIHENGRVVIIEFPDENELKRWYYSVEYQEILKHRLKGAACETVMVKGVVPGVLTTSPVK